MAVSMTTMDQAQLRDRTLLQQVYAWMSGGLIVTALVALWSYSSGTIYNLLATTPSVLWALLIAEFAVVIGLSWGINRMSALLAAGAFLFYAALNGLTLSVMFLVYTEGSIASTFFVTGGVFGAMSLIGYTTKRDLSGLRGFLMMGLIGLLLASVVNYFLASSALYWITTYVGVAIFVGLTAYDTQKIKAMSARADYSNGEVVRKLAIMGALTLYLDFINLFLYLLRIFGRKR